MRLHNQDARRSAFTLLEVLLATAIGAMLLVALYQTMNVQLRHAEAGRDVVEQSTLVRALTLRISRDITQSLGSISSGTPSSSSGSAASSTPTTGTSASSASTPTSSASGSSTASASSSSSNASATSTSTTGPVPVNLGVQGDTGRLILSVSRVPGEFKLGPNNDPNAAGPPGVSDLRRISYWLVGNNGSAQGLARQEYKPVTSDDALNVLPPDIPDPESYIIAEEVKSLSFSYFDGSNWQDTWDGTLPGPDGVTPMGPPAAIAIVLGLQVPGSPEDLKYFRHVVALPTMNNPIPSSSLNGTSSTGP